MTRTTDSSRIVVVGAGLGGLTLAAILSHHGVPVTVYDRDPGPDARPQGGMLDMHEESGQHALRAAGCYDAFRAAVLPGGEAMRILDKHAVVRLDEVDDGTGGRPEVQRETLRGLLLNALPAGTVAWDAKVDSVRALGDGRHEVTFADGATTEADVLVGADGAWSRIRPLLSAATPAYSGISFAQTHLRAADVHHPEAAAVVGDGLFFALGDTRGFLGHREPSGDLEIYAAFPAPAEWVSTVDLSDAATARSTLLAEFPDWDPRLRALITEADDPFVPRSIDALPVGHRWARTPGVTLIGDAAHLMSPFAGEGANLAMLDAADLAAQLIAHGLGRDGVEAALAAYETAMFPRAADAAAESADNLLAAFRPDAPQGLLDVMAAHHPEP